MDEINISFVNKIIPKFKIWLDTDDGKKFMLDLAIKDVFFDINVDTVKEIDESFILELIRLLWSFGGWTNKEYIAEQMLQSELPIIRKAFENLIISNKPLAERFDQMRKIRMMGAASISEILSHVNPKEYPIYNRRAKSSLIKLGVNAKSLPKSAMITGAQYENYVKVVRHVLDKIEQKHSVICDFMLLNFLLYFISTIIEDNAEKALAGIEEKFDHTVTVEQLLQLGDNLGFDFKKEATVAKGCRIDAVWRTKIANLGMITYAFEVQRRGSRDSAILNLQRILNADPTVQKVVFVAVDSEIEKIKSEIAPLTEDFKKSVGYFRVKDLHEALLHQESLKKILMSIGLMKTREKP